MTGRIVRGACIILIVLFLAVSAGAQQAPGDLSDYLPESGVPAGWTQGEAPTSYRGEELYAMIDGGADIYYEYGFTQVLRAEYLDARGKSIKLEIFEMESPAAAYGIYTFKTGDGGKALAIGREALLEDYYLNFWKGNLLVTVIGPDSEEASVQGVVALAGAVDARIAKTDDRPGLAALLLGEPLAFSRPKYVRGSLGVMNSYIFDTEDVFRVREGLIGSVGDCRAFVFRYPDEGESAAAFENASARFRAGPRFKSSSPQENRYRKVGREQELIVINRTGRYIAVVIGENQDGVNATSERLIEKLKNG